MSDIFSPEKRSEIMGKIRGKNTRPELLVFKYLRKEGIYFQKHYRSKQGIVLDVALPRKKKAVFIDGDFWHGRTIERLIKQRGGGKDDYWIKKITRNMERDAEQRAQLLAASWQLLAVWDGELTRKSTRDGTLEKIKAFLIS